MQDIIILILIIFKLFERMMFRYYVPIDQLYLDAAYESENYPKTKEFGTRLSKRKAFYRSQKITRSIDFYLLFCQFDYECDFLKIIFQSPNVRS